ILGLTPQASAMPPAPRASQTASDRPTDANRDPSTSVWSGRGMEEESRVTPRRLGHTDLARPASCAVPGNLAAAGPASLASRLRKNLRKLDTKTHSLGI